MCIVVVSVAEIAVDKQAVVEQASGEQSLYIHIAPSHFAGAQVGSDVPVAVIAEKGGEHLVELSAEGGRE